ncbi:MAG: Uncharacterised protein [Prochlorococcus marinus str. MIT 9215]|nr:MAG: Uncharacterised protein [Prochlorococcus marinus str. MIT 9215]
MTIFKKRLNSKSSDLVHPDWDALNENDARFSKVARAFWLEAVLRNPLQFIMMTGKTVATALSGSTLNLHLDPESFWKAQSKRSARRWQTEPQYFQRLFSLNQAEFERRRAKGRQRKFVFLPAMRWVDRHLRWWGYVPGSSGGGAISDFPVFEPRPLGLMTSVGGISGLPFSQKRLQCLALFLPLLLYLAGTYAVRRYFQPVDWIGFVFVGVFLALIFQVLSAIHSYGRRFQQA